MVVSLHHFRQEHPLLHAALRGMGDYVVSEAIGALGDKVGISLRHGRQADPRYKDLVLNHPCLATVHSSLVAPIGEELAFRRYPSRKLDARGKTGTQWSTGLITSLVFAAGHRGPYGFPLPQFLGGLSLWELQRKDGTAAAAVAHSVRNTFGLTIRIIRWRSAM
ncbi:MAG TPA: CPBP family intramembrane glutamic endopeptidase [Candidatus Saccharimonadales bacterium]|nr:CPBP family intramembrane glutamic endopeptidase [Candidatus Saccharimonadales bacterium]